MQAAIARPVAALAVGVALLAGCAPSRPPPAPAAAQALSPAAPGEAGVIVTERPLLQPRAAGDVRGTILATLGDSITAPAPAGAPAFSAPGGAVEFIVRQADGATLSVVQDNPQHLRPGERVAILRQPQTMLLRPPVSVIAAAGD